MNNENDGTRPYIIKRVSQKERRVIPYNSMISKDISVFVLYHQESTRYINNMEKKLLTKKIRFTNGLDEILSYTNKNDILNDFDYIVVFVSKLLLNDTELLNILVDNYKIKGQNDRIIPIIVWEELYLPETRAKIVKEFETRIINYKKDYLDYNIEQFYLDELRKMQQELEMLVDFLRFVPERDKKNRLNAANKLLKYIEYHRGTPVADRENSKNDTKMIVNNNLTIKVENGGQANVATDNASINLKEK